MTNTKYTHPVTVDVAKYQTELLSGHQLWYALQDSHDDSDWSDGTDDALYAHRQAINRAKLQGWCRIVVIDDDGRNPVAIAEHIYTY